MDSTTIFSFYSWTLIIIPKFLSLKKFHFNSAIDGSYAKLPFANQLQINPRQLNMGLPLAHEQEQAPNTIRHISTKSEPLHTPSNTRLRTVDIPLNTCQTPSKHPPDTLQAFYRRPTDTRHTAYRHTPQNCLNSRL